MHAYNFNTPSRQSLKGIIVIFGVSIYKVIKALILVFAALLLKYLQSDKSINLWSLKFSLPILGVVIFFLVIAILRYRNFRFHINADYFILQKGIFNKEEVSIAKSKIQNVYIKQNVLQQLINVVSLAIETAGDDKTEIEITALERPKAIALKTKLLELNTEQDILEEVATDIKPVSTATDNVFFKASIKQLILEGVTENHFRSFGLILVFIAGLYNDFEEFLVQFKIEDTLQDWFQKDHGSFLVGLIFNLIILLVLLVLSFFVSVVKVMIQNFDLKVIRTTNGLEISKGLFNKINLSLKASRIQTTTLTTNRFKQALGLFQLRFTQAMVNKKQRQKFNIIGLNSSKINELLDVFYPNLNTKTEIHKPHKYMFIRILYILSVPVLVFNVLFVIFQNSLLLLNIPIVLLLALNAWFQFKKKYYSIDDTYITIGGGGLINTTKSFLEVHKIQGVAVIQTIFQKKRNLATIKIYSAAEALEIPHISFASAQNIANYLLFKIESENKDWM